jgi:hypothetical protein
VVGGKGIFCEAEQHAGLAYRGVPDNYEFDQVVIVLFGTVHRAAIINY